MPQPDQDPRSKYKITGKGSRSHPKASGTGNGLSGYPDAAMKASSIEAETIPLNPNLDAPTLGSGQIANAFLDDHAKEQRYRKLMEERMKEMQVKVDALETKMHKKIDRYKKRIEDMTSDRKELYDENDRLRKAMATSGKANAEIVFELKQKQLARKTFEDRRNIERDRMRQELVEDVGNIDHVEETYEDMDTESGGGGCCRRFQSRVLDIVQFLLPFKKDLEVIQIRFGSGMAGYFEFYRYMYLSTICLVLGWLTVFLLQVISFGISTSGSDFSKWQGLYPIWFYYSSLIVPSTIYSSSVMLTAIYLMLTSLWILVSQHRKVLLESDSKIKSRYSVVALNIWDYRSVNQTEVNNSTLVTSRYLNELIQEDKLSESIASRSSFEKLCLSLRKFVGISLNFLIIVISSLIVIGVNFYKTSITSRVGKQWGEFVPPLVLSFVKAVFPYATIAITEFEKHDDTGVLLQHQMWRLFAGKQTFVLALVAVSFNSIQSGYSYDENTYVCQEDEVGAALCTAAVIEFFSTKASALITYYIIECMRSDSCECCSCLADWWVHEEFRASEGVVDLIYFQSLIWISIPLFPFGGVLSTLFLYLNFKFEKLTLTHLRSAPRATKSLGMAYVSFLLLSVVSTTAVYYWFMVSNWDCQTKSNNTDGIFAENTPYETILNFLQEVNISFFFWAGPYAFSCLVVAVLYFFKKNENASQDVKFQEVQKMHVKEIEFLKNTVKRQAMTLEVLNKTAKPYDGKSKR